MDLIYPLHCGGCGSVGHALCRKCIDTFVRVEEEAACPICGMPVGTRIVCGRCLEQESLFVGGVYGYYYENRLREAIHAFKFSGRKDVGRELVRLVEGKIAAFSPRYDCIVPLPVTEKRLRERGFNQSFILGEEISKISGKPLYHSVLRKINETQDQYTLSKEQRKKNIKGTFALADGACLKGKRVLLVDDLYTTGETAREATRTLLKGNVESVVFFALARTP